MYLSVKSSPVLKSHIFFEGSQAVCQSDRSSFNSRKQRAWMTNGKDIQWTSNSDSNTAWHEYLSHCSHSAMHSAYCSHSVMHSAYCSHSVMHSAYCSHSVMQSAYCSHSVMQSAYCCHSVMHSAYCSHSVMQSAYCSHSVMQSAYCSHSVMQSAYCSHSVMHSAYCSHSVMHSAYCSHSVMHSTQNTLLNQWLTLFHSNRSFRRHCTTYRGVSNISQLHIFTVYC
jgi:uncharacterized protein YjbI with pentapeptide repeats